MSSDIPEELVASTKASTLVVLASCSAITLQLLRVSIDLIQVASKGSPKDEDKKTKSVDSSNSKSYGSVDPSKDTKDVAASTDEETQGLLVDGDAATSSSSTAPTPFSAFLLPRISLVCHGLLALVFLAVPLVWKSSNSIFSSSLKDSTVFCLILGGYVTARDLPRSRFGLFQRLYYTLASVLLVAAYFGNLFWEYYNSYNDVPVQWTLGDEILVAAISFYLGLTLVDVCVTRGTAAAVVAEPVKRALSRKALLTMLKPYFWPDATDSSALWNRVRAIMTWVCVILSKICNLVSPILLGWASTALAHQDYASCIKWSIAYAFLQLMSSTFREGQSLVYLKVAQAAFVQLSETTFGHIHNLSLDWHLRKKLGEVIRSMDRGIAACDTLMKYLFLWLLPAMIECVAVCFIFASFFQYLPLGIAVFYYVFVYVVWTILVTLWRKKFRKAVVKSDNEWHDRCTDSLINFETVKYFTAEDYEMKRFGDAVKDYQEGSVNVQASLSFLNVSQRVIMQACLAHCLSLAAYGIQQRSDCCIKEAGCEALFSECCQATSHLECPGMEVGDFVAVLTYTLNLFQPLNFLGSVYNAIVMAMIDLSNLSELLAENPDVTDSPNARDIPTSNAADPDTVVEFDNVVFHYPTQPDTKGLKGLSFKMKRGTTTAIVGPTGAGKTTVSRLLFRFYDVIGGAVKVNGVDVRSLKQKSLRETIGVVPQAASMFNDTIRANMLYGKRDATEEELIQAAKDAQLLDFIESLGDKWETMVGDRGLKLSGGEKQRAAIARCLLRDPPIVLLDEATSALDTLTESSVQEALDRLGAQRTVLVIAHRLGTIRNADNIIVLKEGVVCEQGTHDELLSKPGGVYAEMWNMQLHSASATASTNSLGRLAD
ncbi:Lactococcin-G-processing and transport ATP-binding protein LagD [Seminavis robusta]|uniref:Lactococcin-G-processing and transport ATP-binding protein LagD n=1 Tax=Seminavis robusta TaxID=568900 RepID=A0A9N8EY52_9STRA|nr:Lactococcin-G-processing and transport ATP-binding protein LagD [Seminavis robusta]|eukprot:Sro2147_g316480.1 Lactococcin-G-processing and transport ATP-binding protein LagD (883) ;mRNA; f:4124-7292